ncbi:hypothetical protein [Frigoriglobus tundricola]|uniref:DUF4177 domain-containing protein n=1 Tax=Frigoriglobus tundricola TaxID=2774151 RepID=A0A6M5Z1H8_9BACT|nr:hypothetical protein [Frigoriglobus tundricola]QJX00019.1 hypothetical protein FTUN_7641 [Frigoriglobus tundricola]
MRMFAAVAMSAAVWLVTPEGTASAQEKAAVKWEYAELSFRGAPARPAGKDKDGNEVPATEGTLAIHWTTGDEDLSVKGWDELAKKLKVELKKDSSAVSQKIQVLNGLGAAGWEVVDLQAPIAQPGGFGGPGGGAAARVLMTRMLFKRRVP